MKQIGLGVLQYTQDYDESYPLAVWSNTSNNGTGWAVNIQPYVKSLQVYQCPSDRSLPGATKGDEGFTDYWYNAALSWDGLTVNADYNRSIRSSALLFPSLTIMNGDGSGGSDHSRGSYRVNGCLNGGGIGATYSEYDPGFYACITTGPTKGFATANGLGSGNQKHLEGQTFSFADGHVKWYKGIRASSSDVATSKVYDVCSSFTESGQFPTFNAVYSNPPC